jgi:CRP-like cAMP-binding protein
MILTGELHLKLMDFGLAKEEGDRSLTILGAVLGTPVYISPEQARGDLAIDIRSDIYSLGVTLFHLATGEVPYCEMNTSLLLTKKITDNVPDPRTFRRELSAGTAHLILQFCQRERTNRPTTPRDALALLDQVERGEVPTESLAAPATPATHRPAPAVVSRTDIPVDNPLLRTVVQDRSLDTTPLTMAEGEVLFYEDDSSRDAYILLAGAVEVLKAGRQLAVIDEAGVWIGEMGTLLDAPRTATVRALGDTLLLRVGEQHFREFMLRHPAMCFELSRNLARRLEDSNRRVRDHERRIAVVRRHAGVISQELGE